MKNLQMMTECGLWHSEEFAEFGDGIGLFMQYLEDADAQPVSGSLAERDDAVEVRRVRICRLRVCHRGGAPVSRVEALEPRC